MFNINIISHLLLANSNLSRVPYYYLKSVIKMTGLKTRKKSGIEKSKRSELLIIPTKRLLNWYKYEKEV